jgi:uncharacterized protein YgiM (DUF1202 family)
MLRLLLLLFAGIFVTLQIGGEDRGQKRFGLLQAEKEAAMIASATAEPAPAAPAEPVTRIAHDRSDLPQADGVKVVPVVFATPGPLVSPVVPKTQSPAEKTAAAPEGEVMYVVGRSVNVRSGPSTRNAVVGKLTRGEAVTVVSRENGRWARIRVEGDGIDGYMSADFLTDVAP